MPGQFCQHLEEYGVQYTRTEAAYQAFNAMMDRVLQAEDATTLVESLARALEDWNKESQALRKMFFEMYGSGKILLPERHFQKGRKPGRGPSGRAKCRECSREIPRLEFKEWQVAYNGAVNFRGEELPLGEPISS